MDKPFITPKMKVFELLKYFPETESKLIEYVPEFRKLQNPILRKTITRVTSLEQAAKVGNIPVGSLINYLRQEVGQDNLEIIEKKDSSEKPNWFDPSKIATLLDVRPVIESGDHPISLVLESFDKLEKDNIMEVITPFYPAPLIDTIVNRGAEVYINKISTNLVKTYFKK